MKSARYLTSFAFILFAAAVPSAFAQSNLRGDVAIQATMLRLDEGGGTSAGAGGRVTVELSKWLSLDGEINFYPNDDFRFRSTFPFSGDDGLIYHRRRAEGFVGLKIGQRGERIGVFAKARPGFNRLTDRGVECGGDVCALILLIAPEYGTEFAFDVGGVVEFYPSSRLLARVDVGDVIIRTRNIGAPPCSSCSSHNFTTRFGVGVRF
jgi:hypothetical protein